MERFSIVENCSAVFTMFFILFCVSFFRGGKKFAPAKKVQATRAVYVMMPGELVKRVVEACASWPEEQSGELEGVVRLLGGCMVKDKVSP